MPESVLVSLIVRTEGRRRAYLADALDSAIAQTHRPLEIIVVEDGGTDLAGWLVGRNADTDATVRHVPITKAGRGGAGNAGLAAATGTCLGFLDEDDFLMPYHVELLLSCMQREAPEGAAYASAQMVATRGLTEDRHPPKDEDLRVTGNVPFSRAALWAENFLPVQSVLFHRAIYARLGGFDEALPYFEDWDLWIRYSRECSFARVDAITSTFRVPAERGVQQARNAAHAAALPRLREKHGAEEGAVVPVFGDIPDSGALFRRLARRVRRMLGGG